MNVKKYTRIFGVKYGSFGVVLNLNQLEHVASINAKKSEKI